MMGFCLAELGWDARRFMGATNHEIFAAYDWWRRVNCAKEES